MAAFITLDDYKSTIHADILMPLIKSDTPTLERLEDEAIEEVMGYLDNKYDVDAIFSQTGDDRNLLVVKWVKEIVVYNACANYNPQKFSDIRQVKFEQTIEALKDIRSGKNTLKGAPLKVYTSTNGQDTPEGGYVMSSNKKRINHI